MGKLKKKKLVVSFKDAAVYEWQIIGKPVYSEVKTIVGGGKLEIPIKLTPGLIPPSKIENWEGPPPNSQTLFKGEVQGAPHSPYSSQALEKSKSVNDALSSVQAEELKALYKSLATQAAVVYADGVFAPLPEETKPKPPSLVTQKARGIRVLSGHLVFRDLENLPHQIVTAEDQLVSTWYELFSSWSVDKRPPTFARPCPVRPRHGFVESRVVKTLDEARDVWKEARAADPLAEMILMPAVTAKANAIWLPENGVLTVGPSNDGATRGYRTRPLQVLPFMLPPKTKEDAGIKNSAYVEIVYGAYGPCANENWQTAYAVQLRDGPALDPAVVDHIPARMTVGTVIAPNLIDLLAWEEEVKRLPPNTVVNAPGASLACHAAIHCIINNVPFVTSRVVSVGDELVPTSKSDAVMEWPGGEGRTGFDFTWQWLKKCAQNVDCGLGHEYEITTLFDFAVAVLHNWAAIEPTKDAWRLLSAATAVFAFYGTASCWGESRLATNKNNAPKLVKGKNRLQIHRETFINPRLHFSGMGAVTRNFFRKKLWGPGYGGPKWGTCGEATVDLLRTFLPMLGRDKVARDEMRALVNQLNNVVNLAHNNGWFLDKLVGKSQFNAAAERPGQVAAKAGPVFYAALNAPVVAQGYKFRIPRVLPLPPKLTKAPPKPLNISKMQARTYKGGLVRFQYWLKGSSVMHEVDRGVRPEAYRTLKQCQTEGRATEKSAAGTDATYVPLYKMGGSWYAYSGFTPVIAANKFMEPEDDDD